jgi:thiamine-monophosphate kinase
MLVVMLVLTLVVIMSDGSWEKLILSGPRQGGDGGPVQKNAAPAMAAPSVCCSMVDVETDFVNWLLDRIPPDPRLEVPPGDDAAVLRPPAMRRTVVTVDMLTEGVDFVLGPDCPPRAVGHKAVAVSLSDLAAMGSRPEAVFVAVCLPRSGGDAIAHGLLEGIEAITADYGCTLAGGDTNSWDGPLVVSVTAIGSVQPGCAWRRDGGRPGDLLVVTGACGGSLLGRHLAVQPRVREALAIAGRFDVHAAIDVSDGLSLDLSRLLKASGLGAIVRLADVPIHADARRMSQLPGDTRSPLDHALSDGEDFELILAMPAEAAHALVAAAGQAPLDLPITILGELTDEPGLVAEDAHGERTTLTPRGYVHAFEG